MKKMTIFARILLPAMLVFLLIPPVVYGVFRIAAERQARKEAENDLALLQKQTMELADQYLGSGDVRDPELVRRFLRAVSQQRRQIAGNARLMMFASEDSLIYPYEPEEKAEISSLTVAVLQRMNSQANFYAGESLQIEADGSWFLVQINNPPVSSRRLASIVTFCPISAIGEWIDDAGKTVLLLSAAIALLMMLVTVFTARSITKPLKKLCTASARMSWQNFQTIQSEFVLMEPETLRLSMNDMAVRLQKADQAQKTFFQTVSHELRTPLMAIGGYAQGIEQGVMDDPQYAARIILQESKRLNEMVDNLLTLSRLEQETEEPALSPVCLDDELKAAVLRVLASAQEKGIDLIIQPINTKIQAYTTEKMIAAIMDNLISNALRYAHKQVVISVQEHNNMVEISVRDDGDGIAPEDMSHLFERGYRGEKGLFGIGLSIAQRAAHKCRGSIKAENAKEGGAVFTVELPLS